MTLAAPLPLIGLTLTDCSPLAQRTNRIVAYIGLPQHGSGTLCGIHTYVGEDDMWDSCRRARYFPSSRHRQHTYRYSSPFLRLIDTHIRVYFCFYRRRQQSLTFSIAFFPLYRIPHWTQRRRRSHARLPHPARPSPSLSHISSAPWDQRNPAYSHITGGNDGFTA